MATYIVYIFLLFFTVNIAYSNVFMNIPKIIENIPLKNLTNHMSNAKSSFSHLESVPNQLYEKVSHVNASQTEFLHKNLDVIPSNKFQESDDSLRLADSTETRAFPCPSAESILPCHCSTDEYNKLYMNCSQVTSEEQLAQVFNRDFPMKDFKVFYMANNEAIRYLENSFNGVTFQEVQLIRNTNLELVSQYWLHDSRDTLEYIGITYSKLHSASFPFISMDAYTKLTKLFITDAEFTWLPDIHSDTLSQFAFDGAQISSMTPKTFGNISNLVYVNVGENNITALVADTFPLANTKCAIFLYSNGLTTIQPGTFVPPSDPSKLSLALHLQDNSLTVLDVAVFGPLMPYLELLEVSDNPLLCGCDIAWLVVDPHFMAKVDDWATCEDGTNLHDLDRLIYVDLCFP